MMTTPDQQREWYSALFRDFERGLNGSSALPVHAARKEAFASFVRTGFPTVRHEEWRFTDVSPIAKTPFETVHTRPQPAVDRAAIQEHVRGFANVVVLLDGRYHPECSRVTDLPSAVRVEGLAAAIKRSAPEIAQHLGKYATAGESPFAALGAAFLDDGVLIVVPDGVAVEAPLHIVCLTSKREQPTLVHPRVLLVAGRESRCSVLESYASLGAAPTLTNATTEIVVGDNASVEYDKLQREHGGGYHVATFQARLGRDSRLHSTNVTFGAALARNTMTAVLGGEGGEATLNGLYLGSGTQLIDNHTAIDHAKPHCASHELYKGILAERSRGVFNGKIIVRPDAQKTDAKQTNKNLLLTDEAAIDTKPQLEIYANDVKCTHGATIGQLEEDALFYLRSRGIPRDDARAMLIYAFASDVVDRVASDALRGELRDLIHLHLP